VELPRKIIFKLAVNEEIIRVSVFVLLRKALKKLDCTNNNTKSISLNN